MSKCYSCVICIISIAIVLFVLTLYACGTNKTVIIDKGIKEINLYEFYREGGTTSAGVFNIFAELQADNVKTIKIDASELEMIKTIISTSKVIKSPKWFQSKTGIYLLFFELKDLEGNKHRMYLSYDSAFVDIDNNILYRIEDEGQRLWIRQVQEKYRGKSLDWH